MGLHGSHTWEIFFEDCEVPVENMLGEEGQGYVNALKILANGRAAMAARNLGSADKLLEMSLDYCAYACSVWQTDISNSKSFNTTWLKWQQRLKRFVHLLITLLIW